MTGKRISKKVRVTFQNEKKTLSYIWEEEEAINFYLLITGKKPEELKPGEVTSQLFWIDGEVEFRKEPEPDSDKVLKTPRQMAELAQRFYKSTGGLGEGDFKGFEKEEGRTLAVWRIFGGNAKFPKDLQYKIERKTSDLIPSPPKLGVSQVKNIRALGYMLQRENQNRALLGEPQKTELEFTFKEYAITRGYNDLQIARGGKFIDELKRDLYSGAYTTYRIDKIKIDGKIYTAHGFPNWYILLEPESKSSKWKVIFNEPYKDFILHFRQYYPIKLKAIQDKNTDDKKGYLYFFYEVVLSYSGPGFKARTKIKALLKKIKVSSKILSRPGECYKVLNECISYISRAYGLNWELRFYANGKCKRYKAVNDLVRFSSWNYEDFKREVLTDLGLSDIREAVISFNPSTNPGPGQEEPGEEHPPARTLKTL